VNIDRVKTKQFLDIDPKKLKQYLVEGEELIRARRFHPSTLIWPAMPAVFAFLAASLGTFWFGPDVLSAVLWLVFVVCLLWLVWKVSDWWLDWLVITDKRIFRVHDWLTFRQVDMTPLAKVTDFAYDRSLLGRFLNYGKVRLETAGQVQELEHLNHLSEPEDFYRTLTRLMLGPAPGPPGPSEELLVLREIRDKL
jgi:hypothetical protein